MKKVIFIDVDGTLCGLDGSVPESAKSAIQQAKENGHRFFICTGRSRPELTEEILAIGFDGIIGAGGGYIELEEKVFMHKKMPEKSVIDIINYFQKNDIGYYLESNDGLFGSENCVESIRNQVAETLNIPENERESIDADFQWFFEILDQSIDKTVDYGNVNKISFISNGHPFNEVATKFGEAFQMYHSTVPQFGPNSGEIAVKGVDKETAIHSLLEELQIDSTKTMAYGDGDNDIAMFRSVHHGVAMANATDRLKTIANELTDTAENDGLKVSFIKNKLIIV